MILIHHLVDHLACSRPSINVWNEWIEYECILSSTFTCGYISWMCPYVSPIHGRHVLPMISPINKYYTLASAMICLYCCLWEYVMEIPLDKKGLSLSYSQNTVPLNTAFYHGEFQSCFHSFDLGFQQNTSAIYYIGSFYQVGLRDTALFTLSPRWLL